MIEQYRNHKDKMSRAEKEALFYAKGKVDKAQGFIEAIKQRQHTLIVTMKAIIDIQRQFFLDGDEADLKPMILKDVAERTGLDISTISRVSNVKYAQTNGASSPSSSSSPMAIPPRMARNCQPARSRLPFRKS